MPGDDVSFATDLPEVPRLRVQDLYGNILDYDAFVSFFVCEESLTAAGMFSERDVQYCFEIVDDRGEGRLDLAAINKLYDDLVSISLPLFVFYS